MRAAPATNQLSALEREHRTLVRGNLVVRPEEVGSGDHPEADFFELSQGRLVSRVRGNHSGPQRRKITARRPLLTILDDSARSSARDGFHRQSAVPKSGKYVGLLAHAAVALLPVQNRKPVRTDEVRRVDH